MMKLHNYWRSSSAYRVRIALNLKGVAYEPIAHDLVAGEQRSAKYRAIAPHAMVPALDTGEAVLTQSVAIIEWLDARFPTPPLLPADDTDRAVVRAMAAVIASDTQPLQNLRVLRAIKHRFGAEQAAIDAWARDWIAEGLATLESLVERHGGTCCFGDTVGMADCLLVPQCYNARRYGVDMSAYPRLDAIVARCEAFPAFAAAHPDRQPDARGET